MFIGVVIWFDNNKGFGILALPLGEELFIHIRAFKNPPQEGIKPNEVIVGTKRHDQKRDKYFGDNCHVLRYPEDWKVVVSLLGKADTVLLQDRRKKEQKHSLMELAAKQLLKGKEEDGIFNMLTVDLDSRMDSSLFMPYAEFLEKIIVQVLTKASSAHLLPRVFGYFGTRITHDILFRVWKERKFRYIGYDDKGDYEIPEEVLNLNATEIGYEELVRIRGYSFGKTFCFDFVHALLDGVDTTHGEETGVLVPYLDFLENGDREYWENIIGR